MTRQTAAEVTVESPVNPRRTALLVLLLVTTKGGGQLDMYLPHHYYQPFISTHVLHTSYVLGSVLSPENSNG